AGDATRGGSRRNKRRQSGIGGAKQLRVCVKRVAVNNQIENRRSMPIGFWRFNFWMFYLNFVQFIARDQNNTKNLYRRGQAYARSGDVQSAMLDLEKALTLAPLDKAIKLEISILHGKIQGHHLEQVVSINGVPNEPAKQISSLTNKSQPNGTFDPFHLLTEVSTPRRKRRSSEEDDCWIAKDRKGKKAFSTVHFMSTYTEKGKDDNFNCSMSKGGNITNANEGMPNNTPTEKSRPSFKTDKGKTKFAFSNSKRKNSSMQISSTTYDQLLQENKSRFINLTIILGSRCALIRRQDLKIRGNKLQVRVVMRKVLN
ncbi:hypothetical protein SOVF_143300, partial [Spinacia oleracea]